MYSNSLNKYLLREHYMPGAFLGLGDTTKNTTKSLIIVAYLILRIRDNKQMNVICEGVKESTIEKNKGL